MEMIWHEAVAQDLHVVQLGEVREFTEEQLAVGVTAEDSLALIAPVHHMVMGARVLDP